MKTKEKNNGIKISDIFKQYTSYCKNFASEDIDEDDLYGDGDVYITVWLNIEDIHSHIFDKKRILLQCDYGVNDAIIDFNFVLSKWKCDNTNVYKIEYEKKDGLPELLNLFQNLIMNLEYKGDTVIIDVEEMEEEVYLVEYV